MGVLGSVFLLLFWFLIFCVTGLHDIAMRNYEEQGLYNIRLKAILKHDFSETYEHPSNSKLVPYNSPGYEYELPVEDFICEFGSIFGINNDIDDETKHKYETLLLDKTFQFLIGAYRNAKLGMVLSAQNIMRGHGRYIIHAKPFRVQYDARRKEFVECDLDFDELEYRKNIKIFLKALSQEFEKQKIGTLWFFILGKENVSFDLHVNYIEHIRPLSELDDWVPPNRLCCVIYAAETKELHEFYSKNGKMPHNPKKGFDTVEAKISMGSPLYEEEQKIVDKIRNGPMKFV